MVVFMSENGRGAGQRVLQVEETTPVDLNVVPLDAQTCRLVTRLFSDSSLICRNNERQRSDVEGDKVKAAR